ALVPPKPAPPAQLVAARRVSRPRGGDRCPGHGKDLERERDHPYVRAGRQRGRRRQQLVDEQARVRALRLGRHLLSRGLRRLVLRQWSARLSHVLSPPFVRRDGWLPARVTTR